MLAVLGEPSLEAVVVGGDSSRVAEVPNPMVWSEDDVVDDEVV